ncbi:MAG: hypothetical protein AAFW01_12950 [Pseudomonadota bacterium]
MFELRSRARLTITFAICAASIARALDVVSDLRIGDEATLLAYPLTVIFPSTLAVLVLVMGPARSREAVLMRVGVALQLLLLVALPAFALYLALGMPVVFLVVELFETRLPPPLRDRIAALVVAE